MGACLVPFDLRAKRSSPKGTHISFLKAVEPFKSKCGYLWGWAPPPRQASQLGSGFKPGYCPSTSTHRLPEPAKVILYVFVVFLIVILGCRSKNTKNIAFFLQKNGRLQFFFADIPFFLKKYCFFLQKMVDYGFFTDIPFFS